MLKPEQKPWMFSAGGRFPDPGEPLPRLGIWIAEVMLQLGPDRGGPAPGPQLAMRGGLHHITRPQNGVGPRIIWGRSETTCVVVIANPESDQGLLK